MVLNSKDFIEIEFTGKIQNGEVFDSNIEEDIKAANLNVTASPFIYSLGQGMFLKGIDDFLIGKEPGEYEIVLEPEKGFGLRDSKLIQTIPLKVFASQNVRPVPGAMFNFDGKIAKILSVSGGRVMTDFNNPLAGKTVEYKLKVLRVVEKPAEKADAFIEFLFRKKFDFEIKDKKIIVKAPEKMKTFIEMFKEKFSEVLGLELEVVADKTKPVEQKMITDDETLKERVESAVSETKARLNEEGLVSDSKK